MSCSALPTPTFRLLDAWPLFPPSLRPSLCLLLNTPLRIHSLCITASCALRRAPQAEQRELAATIRVSGSILLSTVSNFLDFFKLEAGKVGGLGCVGGEAAPPLHLVAPLSPRTCVG